MKKKEYNIFQASREDSRAIWDIRFSIEVNQVSLHQEKISFNNHDAWFKKKYFTDKKNICFVLKGESQIIGYCRFDSEQPGIMLISIAIAPGFQGKGLGAFLLSESVKRLTGVKELRAIVKKENVASLQLFEKNNFLIVGEDEVAFYLSRRLV